MILSLLGWLVWFVYGQERFTEGGCLSTSCKTQVNGEMSFYFEVASAYSRKEAVVQGLCRSHEPTESTSCFSGSFYRIESWSGSCCPEDCAHARHNFTHSPVPQIQAQASTFKAKL